MKYYAVVLGCTGYRGHIQCIVLRDHTLVPYKITDSVPSDTKLFVSERSAAKYAKSYKGDSLTVPTGSFIILHLENSKVSIPCGGCGSPMYTEEVALCESCRTIGTKEVAWTS